jgi:pimeloyl-ACP methyl ester carboxylesterase
LVGGEPIAESLWKTLAVAENIHFYNVYGPTECTVDATVCPITALATKPAIGRPIANVQTYILDRHLQPVPIGVVGELYVGGAGVARGYLNRPDLTAERFVPDLFSQRSAHQYPAPRLYRTGDLARYRTDGQIEYQGRSDQQVKIRGFRIELGEIAALLKQDSQVQDAIAIVREDTPNDQRLVAYVVPRHQPLQIEELRQSLIQKLPRYMVPAAIVPLAAIPLTPNGKLDQRSLPIPDQSRPAAAEGIIAPRSELELQLTKIWEEILKISPIGVFDNFFDLGGHSLLAVRLFTKIEQTLGTTLPLAILFEAPTIAQLSALLSQQEWSAPWSPLVTIQANGSQPPLFCMHGGGFNVLIYWELSKNLGDDQPVYALQAEGLDGKTPVSTTLEGLVANYLKEIQQIQPEGPYFLVGLSNGGKIAFEMAQQLHAQGQKVGLLGMFDTYATDSIDLMPLLPRLLSTGHYALRYLAPRVFRKLRRLRTQKNLVVTLDKVKHTKQDGKRQQVKALDDELGSHLEASDSQVSWTRPASLLDRWSKKLLLSVLKYSPWAMLSVKSQLQGVSGSLPETMEIIEGVYKKAHKNYVLKPYPGRVTLFRASEQPPGFYLDAQYGWGPLALEGVDVHTIPETQHVSIVRSIKTANRLKVCMAQKFDSKMSARSPSNEQNSTLNHLEKDQELIDK